MKKQDVQYRGPEVGDGREPSRMMSPSQPPSPKAIVVDLADELQVTTVGDDTTRKIPIGPVLRGVGLYTAGVEVVAMCKYGTDQLQWGVEMEWSMDGESWSSAVELLALQTGNDQVISAETTDRTKFGPYLRFFLIVNDGTASTPQTGSVSVQLVLRLLS